VAGHVLNQLLESGYRVKCTVRSEDKAESILKLRPLHRDRLDFSIVPDISVPGAFDDAVRGVKGVIHTASPFFLEDTSDVRGDLLEPAINGTLGLLRSVAEHNPDVARVVITSSFAAMVDLNAGLRPGHTYSEADWNPVTYEEALHTTSGAFAYCASKALAEKAAWNFMREQQPGFSLKTINPPMVYGPIEEHMRLDALNTSTADIYRLINGSEKKVPETKFFAWVDVRDAGLAHVRALEEEKGGEGGEERYFVAAGTYTYTDICHTIAKWFPQLVNSGLTPNPAGVPAAPPHYEVDNRKSREELGLEYRNLEECVVDTVHSLLKLQAASQEKAPVSVTDVRTGEEHRSHCLVGTGLTVCGCGGNAGTCSCAPDTCACKGCAKKDKDNPTAKGLMGPKHGEGTTLLKCSGDPATCKKPDCRCAKEREAKEKDTTECTGDPKTCTRANCRCADVGKGKETEMGTETTEKEKRVETECTGNPRTCRRPECVCAMKTTGGACTGDPSTCGMPACKCAEQKASVETTGVACPINLRGRGEAGEKVVLNK
jgi:nucleoside-diphosphate-sugar epimerase